MGAGPDPQLGSLSQLLAEMNLDHLESTLSDQTLAALAALDRTPLLAHLKSTGVEKLGDRQKLATAVTKAAKAGRVPNSASAALAACPEARASLAHCASASPSSPRWWRKLSTRSDCNQWRAIPRGTLTPSPRGRVISITPGARNLV